MTSLLERWLDKKALAEHLGCSTRVIEKRMHAGMPHALILGRAKFKASEAEAWLEARGELVRRGRLTAPDEEAA